MSGAIRGAFRSGLYANRSIATPRNPQPIAAATSVSSRSAAVGTVGVYGAPRPV